MLALSPKLYKLSSLQNPRSITHRALVSDFGSPTPHVLERKALNPKPTSPKPQSPEPPPPLHKTTLIDA